ncbi:hypothetical protein [Azohydromonas aeria]|nr:hypothetical protein [Azohydromonas aeria]
MKSKTSSASGLMLGRQLNASADVLMKPNGIPMRPHAKAQGKVTESVQA